MDRRKFLSTSCAVAGAATAVPAAAQPSACAAESARPQDYHEQQQQFRISHTTGAQGGWNGFLFKSFVEARRAGFRYVEVFGSKFGAYPDGPTTERDETGKGPYKIWPDGYVYSPPSGPMPPHEVYYPDRWEALQHRIYQIGLQFSCVTGGEAGKPTDFHDPARRDEVIASHFAMTRFSCRFGCDHQKTNTGRRAKEAMIVSANSKGVSLEDLKNISATLEELGKRIRGELGISFGVHAHLFSQVQTEREITYVMENTNPEHVGFVLDTGHVTMAGMDPVALGKKLGKRIVEWHFKDTHPRDRGGAGMAPLPDRSMMNDPYFYPLGAGGVDFPAIMEHLRAIEWRGFLNVELDASPWRPPIESARITARYFREVLHLEM
jgi:inosose dehydratase